jgi:hypothetical protein
VGHVARGFFPRRAQSCRLSHCIGPITLMRLPNLLARMHRAGRNIWRTFKLMHECNALRLLISSLLRASTALVFSIGASVLYG